MITPAHRVQQLQAYYFARKLQAIADLRAQGHDILNLGIGSPDLPPYEVVVSALQQSAQQSDAHAYQPYTGIPALRAAFAEWYRTHFGVALDPNGEVLPLIGSKEGIMHLSMAFLDPGDSALVPDPGYPTYAAATRLAGGRPIPYTLDAAHGWLPDLDAIAQQHDLTRVKIMWVNYPHMPTGAEATRTCFEQLIDFGHKHQILICNDNPYGLLGYRQRLSLLDIAGAREVAVELNSLSKSHNLAGWRIGVLVGSADHLQAALKFKSNMDSGMFRPLQEAAIQALQAPQSWYDDLAEVYAFRRMAGTQLLASLGCTVAPSEGGLFVWARVPEKWGDGYALSDAVLDRAQVFLTPGGIFGEGGHHYLRLSLCSDSATLLEAQRRIAQAFILTPQNTPQP